MPLDPDLQAWLALSFTPGLNNESCRQLLSAFGEPQAVLRASRSDLLQFVSERAARAVLAAPDPELLGRVETWLQDPVNHVVTLGDPDYPQALLDAADPPPLLYVKGRLELLNSPAFAIVGSRNATHQGRAHAERFGRALSDAGLTVVSGLALGIDAAAHRGGLDGASSSIGVVGTGLDIVYPARNRELAHELARDGCLVSEFALGTAPTASNFPRRNRIISGLGRGCLVVEAALSSGSLITARLANEQGKDVFAVPGSIHSPLTKGCHALIKQGAKLAETAADILDELKLPHPTSESAADRSASEDAPDTLLARIGYDPIDFEALLRQLAVSPEKLSSMLTQWELDGTIETLPGARYQRIR